MPALFHYGTRGAFGGGEWRTPVGSKARHLEQAERLTKRAEECRRLSGIASDRAAKESYCKLADAYEMLAGDERRLASTYNN